MSWERVEIEVGGKTFSGHVMIGDEATVFNIPPSSGLEEGGKFMWRQTYTAASVHDVAQRGEELLVETKESASGKSKTRGTDDSSGGEEV